MLCLKGVLVAALFLGISQAFSPSFSVQNLQHRYAINRVGSESTLPFLLRTGHASGLKKSTFVRPENSKIALLATTEIGFPKLNGTAMRIGIISTRWHEEIVNKLKVGSMSALVDKCGVKKEDIVEFVVPGSWELPLAARYMILTQKVDAIIAIGVLVKGETDHYDMIKDAVSSAIMQLSVETGIPISCGVLGCHTLAQAEARATGDNNHGLWWGQTAVEMASLRKISMGKSDVAPSGVQKKKVLF